MIRTKDITYRFRGGGGGPAVLTVELAIDQSGHAIGLNARAVDPSPAGEKAADEAARAMGLLKPPELLKRDTLKP
jgi:hypothetical protein